MLVSRMVCIIVLVLYITRQLLNTKIGVILCIAAIVMQITASGKIVLLNNSNPQNSNTEYLEQLLLFKKKQVFLQSTIMNIYFILLSLGILLYMIEYTIRMNILAGLLTYIITSLWMLFNWFYLRPKIIKKQQQKLNEIIADLENINEQFLMAN